MTSLHYAAARGSLAIVKVLVKYKAPLDAQDGAGMAPLHAAVIHDRHLPVLMCHVALSLRPSAWFSEVDAVRWGCRAEVAAMLVASGCNVDEADARGYTPLHLAAASGQLSMVRVLVEAGAPARKPRTNSHFSQSKLNENVSTTNTHGNRHYCFDAAQSRATAGHTPRTQTSGRIPEPPAPDHPRKREPLGQDAAAAHSAPLRGIYPSSVSPPGTRSSL